MNLQSKIYSISSWMFITSSVMFLFMGGWLGLEKISYILEWSIWQSEGSEIVMSVVVDWMSLSFLGVVSFISGSILKYSEYYMDDEVNYLRFVFLLASFVISMWFLIISPNLISLLLGWDGLGLSSYALVIFYQSTESGSAGMLTVLSNRVGDVAILISIGLMGELGAWGFLGSGAISGVIMSLVILAGLTKSAQMPFSAWLPAAMAAPTPVSALVHSSTLVTAGVYLLIRFNESLMSSSLSSYVLGVSLATMVMAGVSACFEMDMKKVVALSTLSQVSLMMMVLSVGAPFLSFFHLVTHAMFKSSLFMCVGFMIHMGGGSQDIRSSQSLSGYSPALGGVFSVTNLALMGFPFLAGFYSKDVILELGYSDTISLVVLLMLGVATGATVAYSLRVVYLSSGPAEGGRAFSSVGGGPNLVVSSVSGLFIGGVVTGYVFFWVLESSGDISILSGVEKGLTMVVSSLAGALGLMYLGLNSSKMSMGGWGEMWFSSWLSSKKGSSISFKWGSQGQKSLEAGWLEFWGGQGGGRRVFFMSELFQSGQSSIMVLSYLMSSAILVIMFLSALN